MKATGIVRKIDELGRIVIPKEIRRTLRIRVGDPVEIFTDREGLVVLKKYSPIDELGSFAKEYAEALSQTSGRTVLITDKDDVLCVAGGSKKEFLDRPTSEAFEKAIETRKLFLATDKDPDFVSILRNDEDPSYSQQCVAPIVSEGDVIGSVVILTSDNNLSELEVKLASTAAIFLGKQMES